MIQTLKLKYTLGLSRNKYRMLKKMTNRWLGLKFLQSPNKIINHERSINKMIKISNNFEIRANIRILLENTVHSILNLIKFDKVDSQFDKINDIEFFVKWGFDGTHLTTNFQFKKHNVPKSIFLTMLVPMGLKINGQLIWRNENPNSNKLCRPISLIVIRFL